MAMNGKISAREALARNLRRLMDADPNSRSQKLLSRRTGGEVAQSSISNMMSGKAGNPTLKNLEAIARALKVQPWMLLHPEFEKFDDEVVQALANMPANSAGKLRSVLDLIFSQPVGDDRLQAAGFVRAENPDEDLTERRSKK